MQPDLLRNLTNVPKEDLDKEILKAAVVTELETTNMYEKMAEMTRNPELRATLLDVIRNKRMMVGEFQAHLMQAGLSPEDLLSGKMGTIPQDKNL